MKRTLRLCLIVLCSLFCVIEAIAQQATTTTLTPDSNPAQYGTPVPITLSVQAATGPATGQVIVAVDGKQEAFLTLDATGGANWAVPVVPVGTHTLLATYSGNADFAASSCTTSLTVLQNSLGISISLSGTNFVYGDGPTVNVTLTGGNHHGTLSLYSDNNQLVSEFPFTQNTSIFSPAVIPGGVHNITVHFDPDDGNSLSSVSNAISVTINQANSSTSVASNFNPSQVNNSVDFDARVFSGAPNGIMPTGTVDFTEGAVDYGAVPMNSVTGVARLTLSSLTAGTHVLTGTYSGDANYLPSTGTFTQTVNAVLSPTGTTLTSNAGSYVYNQPVILSSTVVSNSVVPTGSVSVTEGGAPVATITLSNGSGSTSIPNGLSVGNHNLLGIYSGDASNARSSGSASLSVSKATPAMSVSGPTSGDLSTNFSYTVTLSPPYGGALTGNVSVTDGKTNYGSFPVSNGLAICSFTFPSPGSKALSFQYTGDGSFNSSSGSASVTVTLPSTTTNVAASTSTPVYGTAFSLNATVTGNGSQNPAGTVDFVDGDGTDLGSAALTASGTASLSLTSLKSGRHSVTANYQPSNSYASSSGTLAFSVAPQPVIITVTNTSQTYDGSPKALAISVNPSTPVSTTYNGSASVPTEAGSYAVSITTSDPNYSGTFTGTFTIKQASQTITLASVATHHFGDTAFQLVATSTSGLPVTLAVSAPATLSGNTVSVPGSGATTQTITVTASQPGNNDYNSADTSTETFQLLENMPAVTIAAATPGPNSNGWNKNDVTVTLSASDNQGGDGVKEIHYSINGGSETVVAGSGTTFVVNIEGANQLSFYSIDNAGNKEAANKLTVQLDKTLPTLNANPDRSPDSNGWYTKPVTVTYSGSDNGSGIDNSTLTSPMVFSGPDSKTASVSGSVSDLAGNSTSAQFPFKYDATAPIVAINGASRGFHKSLTFSVAATDSGSGATLTLHVVLLKNGTNVYDNTTSAVLPSDPGLTLSGSQQDGNYELDVTCTDEAGWVTTDTVQFTIDNQAPEITFTDPTPADNGYYNKAQTITYLITAEAGVASTLEQLTSLIVGSDVGPAPITSGYQVSGEGQYNIHISATDTIGNTAFKDKTFFIDKTPPTVAPAVLTGGSAANAPWFNTAVTVGINATDPSIRTSPASPTTIAGSGVKEIRYFTSGAQSAGTQSNPTVVPGNTTEFQVHTEGVTTITYWAVDNAGNVSAPQTAVVKFDQTPPSLTQPSDLTVVATSISGATVTYGPFTATDNVDGSPNVTVSPGSGSQLPIGITPVTVTATDAAGNTTVVTFNVTVANPVPTTTGISPSGVQANAAPFSLTVTGTGFMPNSTVSLGANPLATHFVSTSSLTADVPSSALTNSGSFTVTVSTPAPGGGTSNGQSLKVGIKNQTITFNAPSNHIFGDAPFSITATSDSGLPLSFAVTSGPATVSGNVVTITGAGSVTIQASQAGNNTYGAAPNVSQSFSVSKATPQVKVTGGTFTYDGTAHAASAMVSGVNNAALTVAPISYNPGGSAPVNGGTYTATENYPGDANYLAASGTAAVTVNPATQTINFSSVPSHTFGDAPFSVSASSSSNLPVTFAISSGPATISGSTITLTGAGLVTVRASQSGNGNYSSAVAVSQSFSVGKATPKITIVGGTYTYDGTAHAASATVTGVGGVNVGGASISYSGGSVPVNAGTYTITASFSGNANYGSATANLSETVTPATLLVQVDSKTKALNAKNPPLTGSLVGLVSGDNISIVCSTTATRDSDIGVYPITATLKDPQNKAANYVVTYGTGTLKIMYASNSGVRPPLRGDGSLNWMPGLPLPIDFSVYDAKGASVLTPGTITDFKVVSIDGQPTGLTPSSLANIGWITNTGSWLFLLDTSMNAKGHVYGYRITLKDGTFLTFQYSTY